MTQEYVDHLTKLLGILDEQGKNLSSEIAFLESFGSDDIDDIIRLKALNDTLAVAEKAYHATETTFVTVRNRLN